MLSVTGSIQERNNHFQMMVRYTDFDGRKVQKCRSTGVPIGGTAKERKVNNRRANLLLAQWIEEIKEQKAVASDRKLIQAINEWMLWKKDRVRLNTFESYQIYLDTHIKPYFKTNDPLMCNITVRDMQKFADYKCKTLTPQTVKKIFVVLRGTFDMAMRYGEIAFNPCDKVDFSSANIQKQRRFVGQTYTKEQAMILLNAVIGDPSKVGIVLALNFGLRKSEINGLRWCDVDLDNDVLHIRFTSTGQKTLLNEEHTKSESSRRDLAISSTMHEYLLGVKASQEENRKICGSSYIDSGRVCVFKNGKPYGKDYVYHDLKRIQKELGLPMVRLHDLRHTAGSLLFNNGVSLESIKQMLGHEDISVTSNIYVHPDVENRKATADVMEKILFKDPAC